MSFSACFKCTIFLFLISCQQQHDWQHTVLQAGTIASPRCIDLNGDQVLDVVIGAGGTKEWEASENGVLALDGRDGSLLWKSPCRNQLVGSPVFLDIDQDEIPDIITGGRSAQFVALSGKDGSQIWEYRSVNNTADHASDTSLLNFFTPQLIPDQDGDGLEDLLTAYGGYVNAPAWQEERPVGYLMVFSSASGKVLAQAPMPDGKETYMSPVVFSQGARQKVLFGTGGETVAGGLYLTTLGDLLDNDISEEVLLFAGEHKGFIAPPVLTDITQDSFPDIIVNAYEGKTLAIDGQHHHLLWMVNLGDAYETHSQPAVGNFTGNSTLDFFVNFCKGTWPVVEGAVQILIDGSNGQYQKIDSVGNLQYASPLTVSTGEDRLDKVLFQINTKLDSQFGSETGMSPYRYETHLLMFDPARSQKQLWKTNAGTNLGSTLLVRDLNEDGTTEVLSVFNHNPYDPFVYQGFTIDCFSWAGISSQWQQYMGPDGGSHL